MQFSSYFQKPLQGVKFAAVNRQVVSTSKVLVSTSKSTGKLSMNLRLGVTVSEPGRQETYLLVVLQFLTQPGSQYIFAPFAVAPIGQLYLGRSAHCACCRRSWSMGNGGGLLRTCCSTPWDSSSCLSAPYLHAWIGLRSPGADVAGPVLAQMHERPDTANGGQRAGRESQGCSH